MAWVPFAMMAAPYVIDAIKSNWNEGDDEGEVSNHSLLTPQQRALEKDRVNAARGKSHNGAFGKSARYYENLLSDKNGASDKFAAPMMRQYNEEIVPGLSEQFAGMGAGGLSSSGFRNAQIQGGVDLSERIGAMREGLRAQGAQGLMNLSNSAMQPSSTPIQTQYPSPNGNQGYGQALGNAGITLATDYFKNNQNNNQAPAQQTNVGQNTNPYGQVGPQASPAPTTPAAPGQTWV